MLFFSTSRSDLGITMFIAAALCIATLVAFSFILHMFHIVCADPLDVINR